MSLRGTAPHPIALARLQGIDQALDPDVAFPADGERPALVTAWRREEYVRIAAPACGSRRPRGVR